MKNCGFSRKERLLSPFQFKSVYEQSRAAKNSLFWLYKMPNGLAFNRLGISVSNKMCANIVQRNKIKKIIRNIFQCNKQSFGKGADIVVVLKKQPKQIEQETFKSIIISLANK